MVVFVLNLLLFDGSDLFCDLKMTPHSKKVQIRLISVQ